MNSIVQYIKITNLVMFSLDECTALLEYCNIILDTWPLNSQVTKENKVLKRKSQALLPLIPELPENLNDLNLDLEDDCNSETNTSVDLADDPLLKSQAQIRGNHPCSDSHAI